MKIDFKKHWIWIVALIVVALLLKPQQQAIVTQSIQANCEEHKSHLDSEGKCTTMCYQATKQLMLNNDFYAMKSGNSNGIGPSWLGNPSEEGWWFLLYEDQCPPNDPGRATILFNVAEGTLGPYQFPNCVIDEDCNGGQCVNMWCSNSKCPSDCESGGWYKCVDEYSRQVYMNQCVNDECVPTIPTNNIESCPAGKKCQYGACIDGINCLNDNECYPGDICVDLKCVDSGIEPPPSCTPTTEVCNAKDDDCDGQINEGLNCVEEDLCKSVVCDSGYKCVEGECKKSSSNLTLWLLIGGAFFLFLMVMVMNKR